MSGFLKISKAMQRINLLLMKVSAVWESVYFRFLKMTVYAQMITVTPINMVLLLSCFLTLELDFHLFCGTLDLETG